MTRELGINPENHEDVRTYQLICKGQSLQLVADFTISGDREIYGVAHVPIMDRENEIILSDAIREALPHYMELPILHVQHTERPIGTVTKAWVDDEGKLHLHGKIKETPDTDDVWEDITKGELNKFSIFGKRIRYSGECGVSPTQRLTPCITKAMHLFSISVVGNNAMNPETFLEVAKAYGSDTVEEEDKKEEEVEKCGTCPKKADEEEEVEKSEDSGLLHEPTNMSSIMGRLDGVEKSVAALYEMANPVEKSEGEDSMDEKKEEKKDETVEKAAPVVEEKKDEETTVSPEYVVKAELSQYITKAELDTITKAYDEIKKAHDELKARVEKMEQETIEKGGNVVIIQNKYLDEKLGNLGNFEAIGR
jgi:phage head maturation protease